jgi:hypothetical protein
LTNPPHYYGHQIKVTPVIDMKIFLISCSKRKGQHQTHAENLYLGNLFRCSLDYALSKTTGENIYILSAKHHLLHLTDHVEPYDLTLKDMSKKERRVWAEKTILRLENYCQIDKDEFVILAGWDYREFLVRKFPNHRIPLEGLRIGEQQAELKRLIKGGTPPLKKELSGQYLVSELRNSKWSKVPEIPGFYTWYFAPKVAKELLKNLDLDSEKLLLHSLKSGHIALYCGIANNLKERLDWHSAQSLKPSALNSGFLSTLRLTLLSLSNFSYDATETESQLNELLDSCLFKWESTTSKKVAEDLEQATLKSGCYPLNLQHNHRPELSESKKKLGSCRKEYKARYVISNQHHEITPPCTKQQSPTSEKTKIKQQENYGIYKIIQYFEKKIDVEINGLLQKDALPHLQDVAKLLGIKILNKNNNKKNTRQMGAQILKLLDEMNKQE